MRMPDELDRDFVLRALLAREELGSTGVGDGIAIPHVRNPIVRHVPRPSVTLCFLEQAIEFGALDGKPVSAFFTVISPTLRAHLYLMARLAFALRDPGFKRVVVRQSSREDILEAAKRVEASFRQ
jgi:PTS system nitrogen regulatory IIA component